MMSRGLDITGLGAAEGIGVPGSGMPFGKGE